MVIAREIRRAECVTVRNDVRPDALVKDPATRGLGSGAWRRDGLQRSIARPWEQAERYLHLIRHAQCTPRLARRAVDAESSFDWRETIIRWKKRMASARATTTSSSSRVSVVETAFWCGQQIDRR